MRLFEVEQKFNWTVEKFILLQKGIAPRYYRPLKIEHLRYQTFHDTYYDSNSTLCKNGLWVRKRQPCGSVFKWEAKQLQTGSSFLRSTYEESEDPHQIQNMVGAHFPACPGPNHNFGLDVLCHFQTHRHSFLAENRFTVVLDATDFGHRVGEVEVMAEDADRAHFNIDAFLKEYAWFFDKTTEPKGKLTAYFEKFGYPKGSWTVTSRLLSRSVLIPNLHW